MEVPLLKYFIEHEGTWAILFCFMFLYLLKALKDRDKQREEEMKEYRKKLEEDIKLIHANQTFITTTYKLILEKELKRREKK